MSPLWRDEIGIYIGPAKVVLARMRRGLRPKCVAEQGISVEHGDGGDWHPAIASLRQQVVSDLWHDANIRVVVSDQWTRYAILPWSPDLTSQDERMAHARLILNNTYGDVADDWSISLSDNPPLTTTVISAIPTRFLDELREALSGKKRRLVSLQPNLIVAFNSWRQKMPDATAWFASVDEGSLAALHLSNGTCDRVRSVRISDDWSLEMRRMQTMGRLAKKHPDEGRVFVDAPIWLRESTDTNNAALEWLVDDRAPQNIADKVSLLKGMYT
ncbi:MAG: hypothetical protein OEY74_00115 [Gammaproteobacteria bacterium]|nr:hypothetical protein [Gammaproteobacteria bacterium]